MAGGSEGHPDMGVGFRLGVIGEAGAPRCRHVILPVPDSAAYRRDPGAWRINLIVLGPGRQARVNMLLAPLPPRAR